MKIIDYQIDTRILIKSKLNYVFDAYIIILKTIFFKIKLLKTTFTLQC